MSDDTPIYREEPDTITICSGEELYAPVQWNNFKVGQIIYKTSVKAEETPEEAADRATKFVFARKAQMFVDARNLFWLNFDNLRGNR